MIYCTIKSFLGHCLAQYGEWVWINSVRQIIHCPIFVILARLSKDLNWWLSLQQGKDDTHNLVVFFTMPCLHNNIIVTLKTMFPIHVQLFNYLTILSFFSFSLQEWFIVHCHYWSDYWKITVLDNNIEKCSIKHKKQSSLSQFTTAKITFTCILYLQCILHIWFISYKHHFTLII